MTQSASEAGGLAWGWDGDVDEDWEGAALTLLALAVVAATALAVHWFGSAQDQEAAGPASTAPRPSQVGAAGPALPPKHKSVALLKVTAQGGGSQALQDVARGVQLQRAPRIRSPWAAAVWLPQPPLPLRRRRGRGPVEGPWDRSVVTRLWKPSDVKDRRLAGRALFSRVGAKLKGHLHPS